MPDKAIDLVDEACAETRVEIESMPSELDDVSRKIRQLEIERLALSQEKDEQSKLRLEKLDAELNKLNDEAATLTKEWQKEKAEIKEVKDLKAKLDDLNFKLQKDSIEKSENEHKILSDVITEENIASIVSKMTNIPVSRITQGEKERVLNLNKLLAKRVIGQDKAIKLISDAIIRQRAGINDPHSW